VERGFGWIESNYSNKLNMKRLYDEYDSFKLKTHLERTLNGKTINIFDTVLKKMIKEKILVVGVLLKLPNHKVSIRSQDGEITDLYYFDEIQIIN
jgi:hypothetical protein